MSKMAFQPSLPLLFRHHLQQTQHSNNASIPQFSPNRRMRLHHLQPMTMKTDNQNISEREKDQVTETNTTTSTSPPTVDDLLNSMNKSPPADNNTTQKPRYSLRTRLREETEAPFRKARMFVYGGSAISAGVGAFIATLRVLAALIGVSGVQPLSETVT